MSKYLHLSLGMRSDIEVMLAKKLSFNSIAQALGKDSTTISKEIRKNIIIEQKGGYGRSFNDCIKAAEKTCTKKHTCGRCLSKSRNCMSCGKCIPLCDEYVKRICPLLLKPPYVCNGCQDRNKCRLEKRFYRAKEADNRYRKTLSVSRTGVNITVEEIKHLDGIVSPLLLKGQSIRHIFNNHSDEIMISDKTLYSYVNNSLFTARNIDMPRTVRMSPRKNKSKTLKVDKGCRNGRTYKDFVKYINEHPDSIICEGDSVEGKKGGKVLLTLFFVQQNLQLAFLRDYNDARSVTHIFEKLYIELRSDIFVKIFDVLLLDNGSEFSNPEALEYDMQGNRRLRVFYCDPASPYQKGGCENNHEMIRRIIPKGMDFSNYTQEDINLMMSHINSYSRAKFGNKSPYDVFAFQYGKKILKSLGIQKISADEITLTPKLLKR